MATYRCIVKLSRILTVEVEVPEPTRHAVIENAAIEKLLKQLTAETNGDMEVIDFEKLSA